MSATATTTANNRAGLDVVALLKDAGLTAFVALILAIPLVGFETFDKSGSTSLGLRTRFGAVAIGVVAVFFGRLAMQVWRQTMLAAQPGQVPLWDRVAGSVPKVKLPFGPLLVGFAVIVPIVWSSNAYVVDIGITVLIYVMLGWGLNVVVGLAGLLDLGYVAFYAVGAYSYALLYHHFGLTFWECLPLAGLFAAAFGVILGFPVLRLRGDYLAIVTLGFGEIIRVILINWSDLTGGPNGIASIPRPSFFGMPFQASAPEGKSTFASFFGLEFSPIHRVIFLYYVILVLAMLTNWVTLRLRKLPIGRAWEALREDEIACRSLGINPTNTKMTAFAIGASLGGFAGAFFATRQGFISPESFTFIESAIILAIVVLGGMGSQLGVALAALALVVLPELGREFAQYRMLIFGAVMVVIMVWRPHGLLSSREPSIKLNPGKGG